MSGCRHRRFFGTLVDRVPEIEGLLDKERTPPLLSTERMMKPVPSNELVTRFLEGGVKRVDTAVNVVIRVHGRDVELGR